MKNLNFQKGQIGEDIAEKFLLKKGFKLIEKNFQNRFGQIDLIMADKNILVFVEVKLKVSVEFGLPEEMITSKKLKQIENQAQVFLQQNPAISAEYPQKRIDAVCITLRKINYSVETINHYQSITG